MPIVPHHGGQAPLLLPSLPLLSPPDPSSLMPSFPSPSHTSAPIFQDVPMVKVDMPSQDSGTATDMTVELPLYATPGQPEQLTTSYNLAYSSYGSQVQEAHTSSKKKGAAVTIVSTILGFLTFGALWQGLGPGNATSSEDRRWIATSHSWIDRTTCKWLGMCGVAHLRRSRWKGFGEDEAQRPLREPLPGSSEFENGGKTRPEDWAGDERVFRDIPQYVLDHAPYVHLYSGENFWPCDIAEHLVHTTPHLNYTPIQAESKHPNLTDLDGLNKWGRFVFLKSDDNVEERPDWLGGQTNIPAAPGGSDGDDGDGDEGNGWFPGIQSRRQIDRSTIAEAELDMNEWWDVGRGDLFWSKFVEPSLPPKPSRVPWHDELVRKNRPKDKSHAKATGSAHGGRSDAPAVLVVVDKGHGVVDAFWFYFYSYNLGNTVLNVRFGNHIGDWEHTLVRFHHGKPKVVFLSEHSGGEAYSWEAVEKIGKRPVTYSATGTHAMYAAPGVHAYVLPFGLLHDITDRGPLWDPKLNMHSFTYDYRNDTLRASNFTPKAPIGWFYFFGHWGDKYYPLSDPRQYMFAGQYHYVNGPLGPRFKNLGRRKVCQSDHEECIIKHWIGDRSRIRRWKNVGEGEEMSEEDERRFVGEKR